MLFVAACGSEPRSAGAQDISDLFHRPKEDFVDRAVLPRRPARQFNASEPARILVIGDSLAQGFGIFLDRRVKARDLAAVVVNKGRTSTGLARSDFYDWPQAFSVLAPEIRPDVVVAHFGSNDNQSIISTSGRVRQGADGWDDAYRAQVRRILDVAAEHGAVLYLLGPAPDRNASLNGNMNRINPIFDQEADTAQAIYLPLASFAAGSNGEFVRNAVVNGKTVTIRSGDGSHFTGAGYYFVVDRLLADMETRMPDMFRENSVELAGILQ